MFQRLIETWPTWSTLPVRLALGAVFIGHGAQKVFGVWGGAGLSAFSAGKVPLGLKPGWLWLGAAALVELVGGVLVFVGLLTRLGAAALAVVMLVAMFGVHWGAFFLANKPVAGIEYTVALLGMSIALLIAGGGRVSLDELLVDPRYRRR